MKESLEIDVKEAKEIALSIVREFNCIPMEKSITLLNAITCAMVFFAKEISKNVETNVEDGVERMVLQWMNGMGKFIGLNFSRYIKDEETDKNIVSMGDNEKYIN